MINLPKNRDRLFGVLCFGRPHKFEGFSIQIFLVELHTVLFQQFNQLLPKRLLFVVFFLIFDVMDELVLCAEGIGKRSISILPTAKICEQTRLFNMITAGEFDVLYEVGKCNRWEEVRNDMDVVFHAVDPVQMAFLVLQNAPDILGQLVRPAFSSVGWRCLVLKTI